MTKIYFADCFVRNCLTQDQAIMILLIDQYIRNDNILFDEMMLF